MLGPTVCGGCERGRWHRTTPTTGLFQKDGGWFGLGGGVFVAEEGLIEGADAGVDGVDPGAQGVDPAIQSTFHGVDASGQEGEQGDASPWCSAETSASCKTTTAGDASACVGPHAGVVQTLAKPAGGRESSSTFRAHTQCSGPGTLPAESGRIRLYHKRRCLRPLRESQAVRRKGLGRQKSGHNILRPAALEYVQLGGGHHNILRFGQLPPPVAAMAGCLDFGKRTEELDSPGTTVRRAPRESNTGLLWASFPRRSGWKTRNVSESRQPDSRASLSGANPAVCGVS